MKTKDDVVVEKEETLQIEKNRKTQSASLSFQSYRNLSRLDLKLSLIIVKPLSLLGFSCIFLKEREREKKKSFQRTNPKVLSSSIVCL